MWCLSGDYTQPVIKVEDQIKLHNTWGTEGHAQKINQTIIVFFMSGGVEYLRSKYNTWQFNDPFPSFLGESRYIYDMETCDVSFLQGGVGAPQAADTLETLKAMGAENIIVAGMAGSFTDWAEPGQIIVPSRAYIEEGTSLHYSLEYKCSHPDMELWTKTSEFLTCRRAPIVSTDAIYRQTFRKEDEWRKEGAIAVDMETSAVFTVANYLGLHAVSVLITSDKHPQSTFIDWQWGLTDSMKHEFFDKIVDLARAVATDWR